MKNQILQKILAVLCLAAMLITVIAGCGGEKANETTTAASSGESNAPVAETKEPVKLRLVSSDWSKPFPAGKQENIPELMYLKEKLGIELTIELLAHTQYNDLWQMRVASGDVGDFFVAYGAGDAIVANGGVQDLTELVNQYAPEAKKIVMEEQWKINTYKGKIVGLPSIPISNAMQVFFVRKDWMDKLGIQAPKTSDEFLDMLRAFRDRDPNGNNKKDELPFSARTGNSWLQNVEGMFGPTGGTHTIYNGEITIGCLTPSTKQYVAFLKTMYDEGLIDPEFLLNQRAQWEQKIQSGLVGCWVHNVDLAGDWQKMLDEGCPEQKPVVAAINTPVGVGNTTGVSGSPLNPFTHGWLVSTDCKNPEAVVQLYNFLLTEEGVAFKELGIPNRTYVKTSDGKYVYQNYQDTAGEWRTYVFNFGPYIPAIKAARDGEAAVALIMQAIDVAASDKPSSPADVGITGLKNTGLLTDLRNQRYPEMVAQIVTGQQPLDYFDKWAAEQKEIAKAYFDEVNQAAKEQFGK